MKIFDETKDIYIVITKDRKYIIYKIIRGSWKNNHNYIELTESCWEKLFVVGKDHGVVPISGEGYFKSSCFECFSDALDCVYKKIKALPATPRDELIDELYAEMRDSIIF